MKFLLVLAALFIGFWLWRSGRGDKAAPKPQAKAPPALQDMVSCPVCQLHLPQSDALAGKHGWYCSEAHRRQGDT